MFERTIRSPAVSVGGVARFVALVFGTLFLGLCLHATLDRVHFSATAAVDLLPLWLGGHALAEGHDPTDPVVLEAVYRQRFPPVRATSFHSYYPPTAALLARPLSMLPFGDAARALGGLSVLSLVVMAAALVGAAPARGRVWALVAFEVLVGLFLLTRTARGAVTSGQPGPEVVVATAIVILSLGRGHDRLAGAALAVGAALKLFPLVMLAALARLPRALIVFVGVFGLLVAGVALQRPDVHPVAWAGRLVGFINQAVAPVWGREPMWVLRLWQGRFLALGIPSLAMAAWAARRPSTGGTVATAALLAAWGGTVMAGSTHYHEALVLLPAVGWALAWPAQHGPLGVSLLTSGGLLYTMVGVGVFSPYAHPGSLHWVPVGYATWLACAVRWAYSPAWSATIRPFASPTTIRPPTITGSPVIAAPSGTFHTTPPSESMR